MQKIVIGTLLIAALSGLSACAVDTSTDEEALDEPAGEPGSDATDEDPSGDDGAASEGEPDEPVADETDSGEDEIVEKGKCGQSFHPKVTGGEAAWSLTCETRAMGSIHILTISGWVKDTKTDGKCARVSVKLPSGKVLYNSPSACKLGKKYNFTYGGDYSALNGYLQTI